MTCITKTNYENRREIFVEKKVFLRLHKILDLCIITLRPPPRWAKWSRGVRTRGLRVGLVGGPRPLLFLGKASLLQFGLNSFAFNSEHSRIDFQKKCLNIRHGQTLLRLFLREDNGPPLR